MPKSWKSTLLNKVILNYGNKIWFVTNEILDKKTYKRVWFEIETFNWKREILSHIDFNLTLKVSRYAVNINNLDLLLSEIENFNNKDLLYIDEIWEMELFSDNFKELVLKYLNSDNLFIGTISKIYNDDFLEKIRDRKDIIIFELNKNNRKEIQEEINLLLN